MVTMVQQVGEVESDASVEDSDDTPLVCLTTQKRKARVDDSSDPVPSIAIARDVPPLWAKCP